MSIGQSENPENQIGRLNLNMRKFWVSEKSDPPIIRVFRLSGTLKSGIALVELLVAMGLMAIILPALITAFFSARGGRVSQAERLEATATVREAKEALTVIRDNSWDNVKTDGTYHPTIDGSSNWSLQSGSETVNTLFNLTRQIDIGPAYRDSSGNLTTASSGNTLDPSVKHVTITADWGDIIPSNITSDYYLMRFENLTLMDDLTAEFSAGTQQSTIVTTTDDGEVTLGGTGLGVGDWCRPQLVFQALDLDGSGVTTFLTAVEGHAYASTGNNASGHPLYGIDITNPASPATPSATQANYYDPTPQRKAYGIYATGGYVYAANSKHTVDIINPSTYTEAGYFDAGNGQGDAVYVKGTVGYTSKNNTLYAFNLAGSINPAPQLASATLAATARRIFAVGNYVYVATTSTTTQLQIFDATNVTSGTLTQVGSLNLGNNQGARGMYVNAAGDYAYIVTSYASPNFFVIDISSKSAPKIATDGSTTGTYTTASSMAPNGMTVIEKDKRAIVVGSGNDYYQVIDISVPYKISRCDTGLNFGGSGYSVSAINAISSVTESDGDAYSYILTNDSTHEFLMILGGPGGGGVGSAKTGVFTSRAFDGGMDVTWNRFDASNNLPSGTYMNYQVSVTDPVGGSCSNANYSFVGPDKTTDTWFTNQGQVPLGTATGYKNPGRCFKYRASLSTDNLGTNPTLYDITINYSP